MWLTFSWQWKDGTLEMGEHSTQSDASSAPVVISNYGTCHSSKPFQCQIVLAICGNERLQQEEVQLPAPDSVSKANGRTSVSSLSQLENFVSSLSQPVVNKSKKLRQKKPIISFIPVSTRRWDANVFIFHWFVYQLSDQDREASTSAAEKASGFRAFIKRDSDSLSEKSGTSEAEDFNADDELRNANPRRSKRSRKPRFTIRLFPHQLPYLNY